MNLKISENFYNHLVQILVQKVTQHQKKPVTRGFVLYHLMPIAGIEPVTYALRVRLSLIHILGLSISTNSKTKM